MRDEVFRFINKEQERQNTTIELIASENFVSDDVLKAQGSILTNKYAEGYPGKRYYGGCEFIDEIETLAIERAKKLFNAQYANVQPHSGSNANMAVLRALISHGDKILAMDLASGGHLTHGSPVSFSGQDYDIISYGVDNEGYIDYENVRKLARKNRPALIIAGASAYSRKIDFKKFKEIADEYGSILMVDMAHIAGLVAAGLHMNPLDYADVVTSTTHKTLRGPRGGLILTNNELIAKKVNSAIFPGIQGGPLEHIIAAKAVAFNEALSENFEIYSNQVIENAKAMEEVFKTEGIDMISGGTDNHLLLLSVYDKFGITGKELEKKLEIAGITVNKNSIPNEKLSPFKTSGIRIGTPAITTVGYLEADAMQVAHIIARIIKGEDPISFKEETQALAESFL